MEIIIIILISVFIFSAQEMAALFPDRVIAIRGTIDNMCLAEAAISAKLQECYEQDQGQNMVATTFIHSFRLFPLRLFKSTQRRSRHSTDTVLEFHTEAPQATASEGLAQGPYVAARAGFEPTTLLTNLPMSHNTPLIGTVCSQTSCNLKMPSYHLTDFKD